MFRHSSNIKFITSNISDAAALVLLIEGFTKYAVEMTLDDMIYIGMKFYDHQFRHSSNIKVITATV
jgi:hypothetical protein